MITIILAAGNNKRFKGKHKGALKARDGRTVLENITDNLNANPVLVIAQKKHRRQLDEAISNLSLPGSKRLLIHAWLQTPTSGPLDTLWQARGWILALLNAQNNGDCPVVISYCDVLMERNKFQEFINASELVDAGIVIFKSENDRFGDTILQGYKNSGVFYFKSGTQMMSTLGLIPRTEGCGVPDLVESVGHDMMFCCNDIIDIGIPEDYEEYIND